ncbi:Uncharacterized protein TCM_040300 [Theobroma cacao]|uniref:Uncharacterized protein n=1 Tax=Theobroma cacao TaxID=3641 RepID=A0A061GYX0_THECC|nr:Uncharacterized protein TCM_040300 [Theobroma cacao]
MDCNRLILTEEEFRLIYQSLGPNYNEFFHGEVDILKEEIAVWGRCDDLDMGELFALVTKECDGCKEHGEPVGNISVTKRKKGRQKGRKNFENKSKLVDGGRILHINSRMLVGDVKYHLEGIKKAASRAKWILREIKIYITFMQWHLRGGVLIMWVV